jgi:hypothetical protein
MTPAGSDIASEHHIAWLRCADGRDDGRGVDMGSAWEAQRIVEFISMFA